jgi:hypothetical protein
VIDVARPIQAPTVAVLEEVDEAEPGRLALVWHR